MNNPLRQHWFRFYSASVIGLTAAVCVAPGQKPEKDEGVFVRFQLLEPKENRYFIQLGGFIHIEPWYLPAISFPNGADRDPAKRLAAGEYTPWFDLKSWAGPKLHGRLNRSGGIAEFPNISADFVTEKPHDGRRVVIELATAPAKEKVVKRFEERLAGSRTTFLVSPNLSQDKDKLETLAQMQARHLRWARAASGGRRVSPRQHMIQTSFYGPTLEGAEVLSLLGFNLVGNPTPEIQARYPELRLPGHSHDVDFGPAATRASVDRLMKAQVQGNQKLAPGVPFGFSDEICCRPEIGSNPQALAPFHAWLAERKIPPGQLGVVKLSEVVPIEDPKALREREKTNASAARRVFYYTCRFRQEAGTERIRWHTEALHRYFPPGLVSTTLVADHPYFGGTGLGMGLRTSNTTWGGYPLALDWFDLARRRAVDMIGIEDWMGLQYMYGPSSTWEGFQLMGFQAAIMRSGSQDSLPIMAWITPGDETNTRLKSASALAQGAKHFFYWTYGPTAFGTENYWSDLKGEYDGIAKIVRQLAGAEHITGPGKLRKTRLALLYSISSDLWQPFGYISMLERRAIYLALVHKQFLVDLITEEDIAVGRLRDYDVLYTTDACLSTPTTAAIEQWVQEGGYLFGSCGAGSRNEFDEPGPGLAKVFGIESTFKVQVQPGEYRYRGGLNNLPYLDQVAVEPTEELGEPGRFGVLGVKVAVKPTTGRVVGQFRDQSTAMVVNSFGKGKAVYVAACPGLSYLKDARFVPAELKEKYPSTQRRLLGALVRVRGVSPPLELSHDVVEAGLYDAPRGCALVLANFTYQPIDQLTVRVPVVRSPRTVRSLENGPLPFQRSEAGPGRTAQGYPFVIEFSTRLGINDIILLE